tara:strand:+ start:2526 stop:3293 length:768 start_codon:yes stop_codon:yes gene_type:complete
VRILLTGHKGMVGTELYTALTKEHRVIGIDLKDGNNLLDCSLDFEVDLVIHLAGESGIPKSLEEPDLYFQHNVIATKRLFDHFKNTRILYASSSTAKEPNRNPYALTKHTVERIAPHSSLGMRFTTIYSNNSELRPNMLIPRIIRNDVPHVTNHKRDFIHVADIVSAILTLIKNEDVKGVIDIGTGKSQSLKSILKEFGMNPQMKMDTPNERADNVADISVLQGLGWKTTIELIQFLKDKKELDFSEKPKYNVYN